MITDTCTITPMTPIEFQITYNFWKLLLIAIYMGVMGVMVQHINIINIIRLPLK